MALKHVKWILRAQHRVLTTILFIVRRQTIPGQAAGPAAAAAILGENNPSGKLTLSFPSSMNETWLGSPRLNPAQYPGTVRSNSWQEADYLEKLEVGYRWYDAEADRASKGAEMRRPPAPLFEFGFGISYTTYSYSALSASATACSFTVTNAGGVPGVEIAQLYIGFPATAGLPPKQLKGFARVELAPGETKAVTLTLSVEDLSIWSVVGHAWVPVRGDFLVFVGASAADIRLKGTFSVLGGPRAHVATKSS